MAVRDDPSSVILGQLRTQLLGMPVSVKQSSSSVRQLVRIVSHPDGNVSILIPAWNDILSPFGRRLGLVRHWYEQAHAVAVETLRRDGIRLLPILIDLRTEALRRNLRDTFAPWIDLFPFDPLTVTEEQFYEWCVTWRGPGPVAVWGECEVSALPQSREFRNQWRVHETLGVHVDPQLEQDERWRRLLVERDRLLQQSNDLFLEALETGQNLETMKAYRQALRSISPALGDPRTVAPLSSLRLEGTPQ